MMHSYRLSISIFVVLFCPVLVGQVTQPSLQTAEPKANAPVRPDYVLGPNDQFVVRAPQAEEINDRSFRIDGDGFIMVPLFGRIHAGGLSVQGLEAEVTTRLREYIRDPQVTIIITQFRNEPVFLVGAFRNPGIYPLEARTLVQMLAAAGGLQANAGRRIKITRKAEYGTIPLVNAVEDPKKKVSTVEIALESLSESISPTEDISLRPYDIITVIHSELVYVTGEVGKSGGLDLGDRNSIPITQALSLAGGFTPAANRSKVRILRPVADTNELTAIEVDVKSIFEGKGLDFALQPNDVLFVPRSTGRVITTAAVASMFASAPYIIVTAFLH
jgi:polysaccharide export outer membrane protein